jgi:hypothetical protein
MPFSHQYVCMYDEGRESLLFLSDDFFDKVPEHEIQASRFSASGRKMPLEPRVCGACRSCQPMHVLSFGEGRMLLFVVCATPSRNFAARVWNTTVSLVMV